MKYTSLIFTILLAFLFFTLSVSALGEPFAGDAHNLIDPHAFNPTIRPTNIYNGGLFPPDSFPVSAVPEPIHDVSVYSFRYDAPQGTKVGDTVTFTGTIKNNAPLPVAPDYAFFANGQNLGPAFPPPSGNFDNRPIIFIRSGEERTVHLSIQLSQEGDFFMQLRADPFNVIRETNENNNMRSIRVIVRPAEPQPPEPADEPDENNNPDGNQEPGNQGGEAGNPDDGQQGQEQNQDENNNPGDSQSDGNSQPAGSRSDARDAVQDAESQCDAADAAITRAEQELAAGKSVLFTERDVRRQNDDYKDAKRELRDAQRAYNRGDYTAAETQAVSAEDDCARVARKLPAPLQQPVSAPVPTYPLNYRQPSLRASAPPPEQSGVSDEVALVRMPAQNTETSVQPEEATPWLIAGVIIASFLLLGELSALAYFVFRK